jgi:hypothetical protein
VLENEHYMPRKKNLDADKIIYTADWRVLQDIQLVITKLTDTSLKKLARLAMYAMALCSKCTDQSYST